MDPQNQMLLPSSTSRMNSLVESIRLMSLRSACFLQAVAIDNIYIYIYIYIHGRMELNSAIQINLVTRYIYIYIYIYIHILIGGPTLFPGPALLPGPTLFSGPTLFPFSRNHRINMDLEITESAGIPQNHEINGHLPKS